ncbi:hypothetical protein ASPFODRAFT_139748 [Aspergillus luchuensis CBS 106.47]|uniref:FAD-binding domain-containing protein n=1 Tax=Aspergillus luchuensis (strain CBS 106.47) TaxID=1137211 RepID=A0A1M3TAL2_ASPLC|nr:hypothetical protein ASPFODRAFT_139748 [Aspergillus luchuensis CBS 106.47]
MARKFQVIVIGGSISGLTFAHCLDHAGINYVLLEKHEDIEANIGGVITLAPNGTRILAQLGLDRAVNSVSQPTRLAHIGFPDGFTLTHRWPTLVATLNVLYRRLGHSWSTVTRQQLLRVLYTELQDRSKVHVKKRVIRIGTTSSGVSVSTADGHTYYGDLVVGADGVHSITRTEMWRIATQKQPELVSDDMRVGIFTEYRCAFGTSEPVPGILPGDQIVECLDGLTILVFGARDGLIGWCVIQKLDHRFQYPEIPSYSQAEAIALGESLTHVPVRKNLKFSDIWERRKFAKMAAAEEGFLRTWTYDRIACIGDSANKSTPAFGQSANIAIESAATLANGLRRLLKINCWENPSEEEITQMLEDISRTSYLRAKTMNAICQVETRFLARDGLICKFLGRYVVFRFELVAVICLSSLLAAGVRLDYLPSDEVQRKCVRSLNDPLTRNTILMLLISLLLLWIATRPWFV